MSHFEQKISSYVSEWRGIKNLRSLKNDELREYWEQVDEAVAIITNELKSNPDVINHYQLICTAMKEMIYMGEFIRVEALSLCLLEAAEKAGFRPGMIRSRVFLGYVYFNLSELKKSHEAYWAGIELLGDETTDKVLQVVFLSNLTMVAVHTEDLDTAISYGHEALNIIDSMTSAVFNHAAETVGTPPYEIQRSAVMSNISGLYEDMALRTANPIEKDRLLTIAIKFSIQSAMGNLPLADRIRSQANRGNLMMNRGKLAESYAFLKRLNRRCADTSSLTRVKSWIQGFMSEAALQMGKVDLSIKHCHESLRLAIQTADPIREIETLRTALKPLRSISGQAFGGSHSHPRFLDSGMPVIMELLDFLEDKDWYTAQAHSRGVSRISLKLFDVITKKHPDLEPENDRKTLEIASLLHDIGKLWIPWGILNRITPLLDREFDIIRQHPGQGKTFLEELGFPKVGAIIGRHHERPDGAGYPSGDDIGGLAGRILAVADCYEAMTSANRLYRRPLSRKTAVDKMVAQAGMQFDEQVVKSLPDAVSQLV